MKDSQSIKGAVSKINFTMLGAKFLAYQGNGFSESRIQVSNISIALTFPSEMQPAIMQTCQITIHWNNEPLLVTAEYRSKIFP